MHIQVANAFFWSNSLHSIYPVLSWDCLTEVWLLANGSRPLGREGLKEVFVIQHVFFFFFRRARIPFYQGIIYCNICLSWKLGGVFLCSTLLSVLSFVPLLYVSLHILWDRHSRNLSSCTLSTNVRHRFKKRVGQNSIITFLKPKVLACLMN